MFEKVNNSYEFLCSKSARVGSGPDPNNIVLNAEELRREHGMEALETAFERCVGVLSASSKDDDVAVEVKNELD